MSRSTAAFAPIRALFHRELSEHHGAGVHFHLFLDRRTHHLARRQADRDEGADDDARPDFGDAVDHDPPMEEMQTRTDEDRVPDHHTGDHDREAVADTREDRHPPSEERRFQAVDRLGEEGVARPAEPNDLQHGLDTGPKLGLPALIQRETRVRDDGFAQPGMVRPDLAPQPVGQLVV